jgi:quinoprotein glucose dehydrogenase
MRFAVQVLSLTAFAAIAVFTFAASPDDEWPSYGRDPGGQRFSPLKEINRKNIGSLKIAWTYHTGDTFQPQNGKPTLLEATPIYVDGTLYVATPLGRVIALDPVTGTERWSYDAKVPRDKGYGDFTTRGVSIWKSPVADRRVATRIFIATLDARLIALDAATGKPSLPFGDNGIVDLRKGLRIAPRGFADYEETSPPAVIGNTIVVGSGVADNESVNQPSGEVRGFDAVTGKLKWAWDPIPQNPSDPGAATWNDGSAAPTWAQTGAANAWSIIAADPERNLVFVPTSSPSPDYYGGERLGDNLYADSIVALRADSGVPLWHFQLVHHDLWDYDVASPPILFDVHRNGRTLPAVGAGDKDGYFFILNRETGQPIFGVNERPAPKSDVPGEQSSPTQPVPAAPPPLAPQRPPEPWGATEADRKFCADEIGKLRSDGVFTPPSLRGSYIAPGNIGGMAWGGAAYDRQYHLLIIPANNLAAEVRLIPRADLLRRFIARDPKADWEFARQQGTPYGMQRRFLRSPSGLPCNAPPWGVLHAVDADTGQLRWTVPLGQFGKAEPKSGSIALGGPIATAGGLVFMAGTLDPAIYAFDVTNGKQVWKGDLPTSARSTPMTFRGPNGKQYLVVSAGGHGVAGMAPLGDAIVAFAVP